MKQPLPSLAVATLLALAACNNTSQPAAANDAADADGANVTTANAAPVVLPPAIRAEVTMRCKDNSLAHFVFFQGDTKLRVRAPQTADAVELTALKAGDPFTAAGGWKVTGDQAKTTLTQPGKDEQSCKA